jgi:hypothetical protein
MLDKLSPQTLDNLGFLMDPGGTKLLLPVPANSVSEWSGATPQPYCLQVKAYNALLTPNSISKAKLFCFLGF